MNHIHQKKTGARGASQAGRRHTKSRKQPCVYIRGEWEMRPRSRRTDSGMWMSLHPVRGSQGHLLNRCFSNISTFIKKKKITPTCSKMQISRSYKTPFPWRFRFRYPRAGPSNLHFKQHDLVPPPPTLHWLWGWGLPSSSPVVNDVEPLKILNSTTVTWSAVWK